MRPRKQRRSPKEVREDRVRHDYATATVTSRETVDTLTAIFAGKEFSRDELRHLHDNVRVLYDIVYANTLLHLEPERYESLADVDAERDRFHDRYSDGSPVTEIRPTSEAGCRRIHRAFLEGDIPWFPNPSIAWPAELDRCHWGTGPAPDGWEVVVKATPESQRARLRPVLSAEQVQEKVARFESMRASLRLRAMREDELT